MTRIFWLASLLASLLVSVLLSGTVSRIDSVSAFTPVATLRVPLAQQPAAPDDADDDDADDDDADDDDADDATDSPEEPIQGPEKDALDALEKGIKSLGSLPRAAKARSERLLELEEQFEEIRQQWPETAAALQALAYRSECQRRLGRTRPATEGYQQYLALGDGTETMAVALHGLGHCLEESFDWAGAQAYFEQVPERFPDHELVPECLYDGGFCLREQGKYDQARSVWNRLISRFPRKGAARKAQNRLATLRPPRERMMDVVRDWDRQLARWNALPYAEKSAGTKELEKVLDEAGDCRCRESERFLRQLLDHPDKNIQAIAAVPLLAVGDHEVAQLVLKHLPSLTSLGRRQVLDAMRPRHLTKVALKPLERWAKGSEMGVATAAIDLLGRIGSREATRMMVGFIPEGTDPETLPQNQRRNFDQLLRSLRSVRDPKALKWLNDKKLDSERAPLLARYAAADVLGRASYQPAEPVLTGLLLHPAALLRKAAVRALALLGSSSSVEDITRASRKLRRDIEFQREAVRALIRLDPTAAQEMLLALGNSQDVSLRTLVITALGKVSSEESLVRRIEALIDPAWQVRSAALRSLGKERDARLIDALLDAMEREKGALLPQVVACLIAATGADLGPEVADWRKYWERERDRYDPVDIARREAEQQGGQTYVRKADPDAARTPSYFGVEIVSRRIAFVIDCSGSMSASVTVPREGGGSDTMERIALAKDELLTAVEKLRPGTFFNLIKFSNNPVNLHPKPVRLSKKSVKTAQQFVLGLQPGGGTNIYDSLAEVLKAGEVDTIFFLSDGAPSMGTFIDTERILEEILRLNEESQVTIHTISVGFTSTFMEQLAEQNRGSYIVAGR